MGILSDIEKQQYSRQIILEQLGEAGQEKLKNARVLVIGAGALGSAALTYLTVAGVGIIGICEGDVIDRSNLHRQVLFTEKSVGESKLAVTVDRLQQLNPYVKIEPHDMFVTPENIAEIVSKYDFVIDATDRIETKFLINDACVLTKTAFCHAGVLAFEGQAMTWVPDKDVPCYRCVFGEVPDEFIPNCSNLGVIGAMSGILGNVQAMEAIKYITSMGQLLTGRLFHLNGLDMKCRTINIKKNYKNCKVCGDSATIGDVRDNAKEYVLRQGMNNKI